MPLLHPNQRKSFTINKDTALYLASKLAAGQDLAFQSTANRNWVAKLARTRYGVNTQIFVKKDILFSPSQTVEGYDLPNIGAHYMTVYVAKLDKSVAPQPLPTSPTTYSTYVPPMYHRREDLVR